MLILDRKSKIYHHNYIDILPVSLSWKKKIIHFKSHLKVSTWFYAKES